MKSRTVERRASSPGSRWHPSGRAGRPALHQPLLYNCGVGFLRNLKITLEMIKWEHSIFALPFALCGAMLAAGGLPAWHQLGWIVVAMVSRSEERRVGKECR